MATERKMPVDVARRLGQRRDQSGRTSNVPRRTDGWCRETFTLTREDARSAARDWFTRFPKAAYMTEIESWKVLDDGRIEFTMRRLPSAD
ncbi:hypothetical protein [Lichenifustis flavocetrariae]|uniref:Uncharacterized protein n=1 Tax=Lichenifustis flavocetrariae TaxID=2949735 RepID=A0AA41Z0C8_9HYPH|nr:hypothetical protein [Lichenifustis flavocetrariae]MCW6508140.1 hypothetical protein [Lichenifustis flavocetrariae]